MWRRLPPLRAVAYFEAAAELKSLVRTAERLGVTKGAVSQQIRQLEEYLGLALFDRSGRSLELTDAGQRYYVAAQSALDGLERATQRLSRQRQRRSLRVTVLPAFAALWLAPRLQAFQEDHPEVDIEISSDAALVDFSRSDAHLGIRFGSGEAAGLTTTALGLDRLSPLCSPGYARRLALESPDDLARCRLLHDTYWHDDWRRWCDAVGFPLARGQPGQYFSLYSVAIDVARAGGGLAMGHDLLVEDLVRRGDLVRPFAAAIEAAAPYTLVRPQRSDGVSIVADFEAWVRAAFTAGPAGR